MNEKAARQNEIYEKKNLQKNDPDSVRHSRGEKMEKTAGRENNNRMISVRIEIRNDLMFRLPFVDTDIILEVLRGLVHRVEVGPFAFPVGRIIEQGIQKRKMQGEDHGGMDQDSQQ